MREFMNIAHRGASGRAPEHTLVAYDLAVHAGAHFIELDVHMSSDDTPVVVHDACLNRVATSSELVSSMTVEELRAYDVGTWFNELRPHHASPDYVDLKLVTLEDALARYRHCARFCIELKQPHAYPGIEEKVLEVLSAAGLDDPVATRPRAVILSSSTSSLEKIHGWRPGLPLLHLFDESETEFEIRAHLSPIRNYASGIVPWKGAVGRNLLAEAHELELLVVPFTVNRLEEMARFLDLGVDGMITDYPERLHELVREYALATR